MKEIIPPEVLLPFGTDGAFSFVQHFHFELNRRASTCLRKLTDQSNCTSFHRLK